MHLVNTHFLPEGRAGTRRPAVFICDKLCSTPTCMYVCVYVCARACMYVCENVCMCGRVIVLFSDYVDMYMCATTYYCVSLRLGWVTNKIPWYSIYRLPVFIFLLVNDRKFGGVSINLHLHAVNVNAKICALCWNFESNYCFIN